MGNLIGKEKDEAPPRPAPVPPQEPMDPAKVFEVKSQCMSLLLLILKQSMY